MDRETTLRACSSDNGRLYLYILARDMVHKAYTSCICFARKQFFLAWFFVWLILKGHLRSREDALETHRAR